MIMIRQLIALVACSFMFSIPVAAQDHSDAKEAKVPEMIVLPFDPPLGTPLSYRVLVEKKRPKGNSSLEFEQELTFERTSEGYTLDIDNLAALINGTRLDLGDPAVQAAIPTASRPFILSLELDLDRSGEPLRVRNWNELSAMLASLPDEVANRVQSVERDEAKQLASEILGPYINATAEDAPWLLVKGWPSVLGYGGADFENAAEYEADSFIGGGGGVLAEPIDARLTFSLTRTIEGNFRLVQTTTPDPNALALAIVTLLERVAARTAKNGQPTQFDPNALDGFSVIDTLTVVFERETGLPVEASIIRSTSLKGETLSGDIVTMTRMEP